MMLHFHLYTYRGLLQPLTQLEVFTWRKKNQSIGLKNKHIYVCAYAQWQDDIKGQSTSFSDNTGRKKMLFLLPTSKDATFTF